MKNSVNVQLEHYRGYQIELRDRRDGGWVVGIFSSQGLHPGGMTLRSDSSAALAALMSSAREKIDLALEQTVTDVGGLRA